MLAPNQVMNLVRFAHNWNNGMLEKWNDGFKEKINAHIFALMVKF
jgi:hypothetical protein